MRIKYLLSYLFLFAVFRYIYVPAAGRGHLSACVAELLCGDRAAGPSTPEFSAPPAPLADRMNRLINDHSSDEPASPASARESSGSGDATAGIGAWDEGEDTTRAAGEKAERVTDIGHARVGDDDKTPASSPARNRSSTGDSAPASAKDVPYVVHPMLPGAPPAESYVVKIGNAADDGQLVASGAQGAPVWRHDDSPASSSVSPTVIAVLTSLGVAIFFVIACVLDDDDGGGDCAVEFEAVEPFQTKSAIPTFTSVLDSSITGLTSRDVKVSRRNWSRGQNVGLGLAVWSQWFGLI